MTFADQYKAHAYADLILEAETQGIEIGVEAERERIIALLEAELGDEAEACQVCDITRHHIALIEGENNA